MRRMIFKNITIILCTLCLFIHLTSCIAPGKLAYYSDTKNYVSAVGTITHIAYNKDSTELYLGFSELNPTFDDTCFKIVGNNLSIVQSRGIDDKIKIGDRIEFVTAPKYFGDGYVMPIVALTVKGESLLEFEDGYTNLLNWL